MEIKSRELGSKEEAEELREETGGRAQDLVMAVLLIGEIMAEILIESWNCACLLTSTSIGKIIISFQIYKGSFKCLVERLRPVTSSLHVWQQCNYRGKIILCLIVFWKKTLLYQFLVTYIYII